MEEETRNFLVGVILIVSLGLGVAGFFSKENRLGLSNSWNIFTSGVTNSSTTAISPSSDVWASTTDANTPDLVVARNADRKYLRISNWCNAGLWLHLTDSASSVVREEGIYLRASSTDSYVYEIGPDNLWIGAIYGVAESATCTVTYTEK